MPEGRDPVRGTTGSIPRIAADADRVHIRAAAMTRIMSPAIRQALAHAVAKLSVPERADV